MYIYVCVCVYVDVYMYIRHVFLGLVYRLFLLSLSLFTKQREAGCDWIINKLAKPEGKKKRTWVYVPTMGTSEPCFYTKTNHSITSPTLLSGFLSLRRV